MSHLFVFMPCHSNQDFQIAMGQKPNLYAKEYMHTLNDISESEIVNRVEKTFKRFYLGHYPFPVYSDAGLEDKIDEIHIDMFLTMCNKNRLGVVTLHIDKFAGNISHIIDQVSREDLFIGESPIQDFLYHNFALLKNGEAKMVLSQKQMNDDILYYMATETSDSAFVKTELISKKYKDFSKDNIAVYDFSDIYASESLVYQVINDQAHELQYQGLLIFIVEILVIQLAAIYRTNNKISNALEENQRLNVKDYEAYSIEFANTLSIWQIDIFRYKGAQTIANKIADRFGIKHVLDNYKQNDEFLQNIINTRNVKNSMFESMILFIIAIVLFFKELFLIVQNIVISLIEGVSFTSTDMIGSISSTTLIILLIIVVYYIRRRMNKKF